MWRGIFIDRYGRMNIMYWLAEIAFHTALGIAGALACFGAFALIDVFNGTHGRNKRRQKQFDRAIDELTQICQKEIDTFKANWQDDAERKASWKAYEMHRRLEARARQEEREESRKEGGEKDR